MTEQTAKHEAVQRLAPAGNHLSTLGWRDKGKRLYLAGEKQLGYQVGLEPQSPLTGSWDHRGHSTAGAAACHRQDGGNTQIFTLLLHTSFLSQPCTAWARESGGRECLAGVSSLCHRTEKRKDRKWVESQWENKPGC